MRRKKRRQPKKKFWRLNHRITAPTVRVLSEDDKQIGVLEIRAALAEAKKAGLDLVEIAPLARPPVAKIVDFGKFRYREEKKNKGKKQKGGEQKEVRFSPFIAEGDYNTRLERIKEFLAENNKIKVVVKFKGRQMGSKQFGYNLCQRIIEEFEDSIAVDMHPKFVGRHLSMVFSPVGTAKKIKESKPSEKGSASRSGSTSSTNKSSKKKNV